jgi:transcriptional regulator with XRE-family HTH domain
MANDKDSASRNCEHMTPERLQEIRKKFKLSLPQLAGLMRVPIQPARKPNKDGGGARSATARTVSDWLNETYPIPDSVAELLEAKVWLLEHSNLSVETLLEHELPYALALFRSKLKAK